MSQFFMACGFECGAHFGRIPHRINGIQFFEWESAKDISKYAPMDSVQVTTALNVVAPSMIEMNDLILEKVVRRTLAAIKLKMPKQP